METRDKKMERKEVRKKIFMSLTQIFILVVAMFAFSYVIGEINDDEKESDENNSEVLDDTNVEETDTSFGLLGRISKLSDLFKWNFVDSVSAQAGNVCCEVTNSGESCQMASSGECNQNYQTSLTECSFTDYCKIGCCRSPTNGICSERVSKAVCENTGGIFDDDEACNIVECRLGCCVIGGDTEFVTEANCQWEGNTQNRNIPTDWRQDTNYLECRFLSEGNQEGACVFETGVNDEKSCVLTSLDECIQRTGSEINFITDKFCSDPLLNTTCTARDHKRCVAGQEDVYWFDSCDNKEAVAEDCDLYRGNFCGQEGGEYVCKDITCDTNGDGIKDRANGESWCSYDGFIGNGKDPAGSRHVKHICYFGTERIAPCADFRNEICVQEDSTIEGKKFSQASCRVNRWSECLNYNTEKNVDTLKEKCEANVDCRHKYIDMTRGKGDFKFDVCLPNYPPGYDLILDNLYDENGNLNENYNTESPAEGICDIASSKCTERWICTLFGCSCDTNCDCHEKKFTKEMNDFCVSLGDCGAYINYIGDESEDGYTVKGSDSPKPPRQTIAQMGLSQYANEEATPAEPGSFELFETLNPELLPAAGEDGSELSAFERELLNAAGAYGSPLLLQILKQDADNATSILGGFGSLTQGVMGLSRFTSTFSSVKSAIISQVVESQAEKKDFSMIASMIAGAIGFAIAGALGAMIFAALAFIFFFFWVEYHDIYFTCLPWEPPDGGEKCNECNKLDVPCTEYRCESLGQLCQLINKGTGNELCVARASDENPPVIQPFETAISEGYEYHNVNANGFEVVNATDQGCIEPFTPVDIGIKVSPFARCRYGVDPQQTYQEMSDLFGPKGNYVIPAHLMKLFFVSPEAFKNAYNLTENQIRDLGQIDYYVKCKTASGKINPTPYNIKSCVRPGPDLTAPLISPFSIPLTSSYIQYDVDEVDLTLYVNEPSECRYSLEDKNFDDMENQVTCETDPSRYALYGLPCNVTLTGLREDTTFYFRCRDLSENGNTMTESFVFEFISSTSELSIDEVLPAEGSLITSAVEPVSARLSLSTSGGANNGEATCSWEGNSIFGDNFIYENENGSNIHEYSLTRLSRGRWNINFMCEDLAGNTAERSTYFDVRIDSSGPRITRIYFDNGELRIVTNENAECRQDFIRNFVFEDASLMSSGDDRNHFATWEPFRTYYVQCKDDFGNKGGKVNVRPYV